MRPQRSLIAEADGGPLGMVVAGANDPDAQILTATIRTIAPERPPVDAGYAQHRSLVKSYADGPG